MVQRISPCHFSLMNWRLFAEGALVVKPSQWHSGLQTSSCTSQISETQHKARHFTNCSRGGEWIGMSNMTSSWQNESVFQSVFRSKTCRRLTSLSVTIFSSLSRIWQNVSFTNMMPLSSD